MFGGRESESESEGNAEAKPRPNVRNGDCVSVFEAESLMRWIATTFKRGKAMRGEVEVEGTANMILSAVSKAGRIKERGKL